MRTGFSLLDISIADETPASQQRSQAMVELVLKIVFAESEEANKAALQRVFFHAPEYVTISAATASRQLTSSAGRTFVIFNAGNHLDQLGLRMAEYQAYFVGLDGHFLSFKTLACSDDAEAIEQANELVDDRAIELWSGNRFITRLNCRSK